MVEVTACECEHLTNFGIMFDYTGTAEADHAYLNILSWVLLIISSASILVTQLLFLSDKADLSPMFDNMQNPRTSTAFSTTLNSCVILSLRES